jgi:hypothetical protein
MNERVFISLSGQEGRTEIRVGDAVVLDPTGREMLECAEVGFVTMLEDGDATVHLNSGGTVGAVNNVFSILSI